ncbi:hypothetical protein Tco_1287626, partial [Tanacetum coccineum]
MDNQVNHNVKDSRRIYELNMSSSIKVAEQICLNKEHRSIIVNKRLISQIAGGGGEGGGGGDGGGGGARMVCD